MKTPRFQIILLVLAAALGFDALAQSGLLTVERRGEFLYVAAPQLHFLAGRIIEKLRDGATVDYVVTLTAAAARDKKQAAQLRERFSVSFDLWEEKYSVVQRRQNGRGTTHLTADMAEKWILDAMPLPVQAIPELQPFIVRLECFADQTQVENDEIIRPMLTLSGLIDIFSRRESEKPLRWEAVSVPLLLRDLYSRTQLFTNE
jgi:hypothetical protein